MLEAAYNDSQGVTAEFNLNALRHINERLQADFDLSAFVHEARYDAQAGCIRMFLESTRTQTVHVAGKAIEFAAGEAIHTENSFKYDPEEFRVLAGRGGFRTATWWTDEAQRFALFLLQAQ